jgi:hypothetical protein
MVPVRIVVDPYKNVRTTDPLTSRAAAYTNKKGRVTQRDKVQIALDAVRADGMTDEKVWQATGIERLSSATKRRGELTAEGIVILDLLTKVIACAQERRCPEGKAER